MPQLTRQQQEQERLNVEQHRAYFLSMERRLIEIGSYVALEPDNYRAYSVELTFLLQAAASEFDTLCKIHCHILNGIHPNHSNIRTYRDKIPENAPLLVADYMTDNKGRGAKINPFLPWGNTQNKSLPWWNAYNKIKHNRGEHYKAGNVRNTVYAMSACLGALSIYPHQNEDGWQWANNATSFFRICNARAIKIRNDLMANIPRTIYL